MNKYTVSIALLVAGIFSQLVQAESTPIKADIKPIKADIKPIKADIKPISLDNKVASDPYLLVQTVADKLFKSIASQQSVISENPEVLKEIVEKELAPSINHKYAAAKIMGSAVYRKATPEQKSNFFAAFREYLISTYAGIMTLYKNQQVIFEPAQSIKKDAKIVPVKVRVLDEGKPDIEIVFKMRLNSKTGTWSAFDMVAEGVAVLKAKKAELSPMIRKQGLDSVAKTLKEKAAKPIVVKEL